MAWFYWDTLTHDSVLHYSENFSLARAPVGSFE